MRKKPNGQKRRADVIGPAAMGAKMVNTVRGFQKTSPLFK